MRIHLLSDLHREFGPTDIPAVDCDLIILAGDISTKQSALPWIQDFSRGIPTVYICGNHEFYGDKLPGVTERLKDATQGTNIHVLENDSFEIQGWHLYACTLWTNLALQGAWENGAIEAQLQMNDYKRVRLSNRGYRKLSPRDTRAIHLESVRRLEDFLRSHDPRKTIVVTHHAPSAKSLPIHRRDEAISCAYASHLDEFILTHQPKLWVHGHIHHSQDYKIGETRIVANPQGYPDSPNPHFQADLTIEL